MEWDGIPIEQLSLSARVVKCLRSAGYNYVSQILELSIDDIESLQNIGSKSAQELVTVISHIKSGKIYLSKGIFGETIINKSEDADDGERTVLQRAFPDLKTNDVVQIKYMDQNGLYCDDLHILNCGFSPRTENALRRSGYEYISEIVALNENDINNINSLARNQKMNSMIS
ncbi:DNA-directed RNA polymerase subunit alpha C-terminal domain-containing protein [Butyrivibrio fibrisolvens]|uniref:DNA-directed RNA polymerase subunit alpha C-terminal domain-containing protein n=1 Tax=Butyrivibrio fibrisolvens TaxID=831 RepID=UPI0030D29F68